MRKRDFFVWEFLSLYIGSRAGSDLVRFVLGFGFELFSAKLGNKSFVNQIQAVTFNGWQNQTELQRKISLRYLMKRFALVAMGLAGGQGVTHPPITGVFGGTL